MTETTQQMLERWDDEDAKAQRDRDNATIEECARVVDRFSTGLGTVVLADIAAAIRAMKES